MEQTQNKYSDDIIFINRSNFDKDEFIKINVIITKRFAKFMLFAGLLILICDIIYIVASVLDGYKSSDLYYMILFGLLGLFFICYYFFLPVLIKKNKNLQKDMNYEFLFYDDKFKVNLSSETIHADEERKYSDIKYVVIKGEYVFIYMTRVQSYIMKKDVNAERMLDFIRSKNVLIK